MPIDTLTTWHHVLEHGDLEQLHDLLHPDVVFHSPVVHADIVGRDTTMLYLAGAFQVLTGDDFRYVREIVGHREAVLEFVTVVDGLHVNGIDLITWDDDGRIVDFTVMVRPLKAINAVHAAMGALLAAASVPATSAVEA